MSLFDHSVSELHKKLNNKEISVTDLVEESYKRIADVEDNVKAFLTLDEENARAKAKELDAKIGAEDNGLLFGMPIGVKDNIVTNGLRTTCASKMLANFDPIYDATVLQKLKAADTITIGKLNMDEFAMGSSNENSGFYATKNPWNLDYVPGGSSGGSAAAVAAGEVLFSLGSDTGGSIRQPAAYCGVVGLKPTYGRVSRYGLVAFASSLDQIGVIAKSAEDTGYMLEGIYGYDENDATSSKKSEGNYNSLIGSDVSKLKIGVPKEFFGDGLNDEVKTAVLNAVEYYKKLGCEIVDVSLPSLEYAVSAYYLISSAEAASNLSRFDGIKYGLRSGLGEDFNDLIKNSRREGFGQEVKRRIMLGNYALCSGYYDAYYKNATRIRTQIRNEYADIFRKCDVMLTPTAPTTAYKIGEQENDPVKMYLADIYTVTVNIAGLPAISTTCGYDSKGLPIGMSLIGKAFDEKTIIAVCDRFEKDFERKEIVL